VILGVAVLLDTMLVRLLLLPAVLRLLGERAWWVPSRIDRWLPAIRLRDAEPETRQRASAIPSRSRASRARRSFSSCPFAA
jgi:RND superfamily putative drug exporter